MAKAKFDMEAFRAQFNGIEEPVWLDEEDHRILDEIWDEIREEKQGEKASQRIGEIGQLPDSPEQYGRRPGP